MTIEKAKEGEQCTLKISGRLDTTTAPQLEVQVNTLEDDINDLSLDLAELEYISSAGLRVILAAHKKMNNKGKMTVKNVNEVVMEVFDITGFADILTIK